MLGPVELAVDGRTVVVAGRKPRLVLAVLAMHAGEAVGREELAEALWADDPPAGAAHALDVHESRLRVIMRDAGVERLLERRDGALRLWIPRDAVDALRFEEGVAAGCAALASADYDGASKLLTAALDEWRGVALADLTSDGEAVPDAARLADLRLGAIEAKIDADLALGRDAIVLGELHALALKHPLHERFRAQLMTALYNLGRQAEALEVFRQTRELLVDELGIEPSEELARLEQLILRHDRSLSRATSRRKESLPVTHYTRSDGAFIAYQVTGEGQDVVYIPPFLTNVELVWQVDAWAALFRRLALTNRLIRYDKRGTGMSDRIAPTSLDEQVADLLAVMDAARSRSAVLIGPSAGGALAVLFAATYPKRVRALILWATVLRSVWAPDNPAGTPKAELDELPDDDLRIWTVPGYAETMATDLGAADPLALAWLWRHSATPSTIRALDRVETAIDVNDALSRVTVPTLILNRIGDTDSALAAREITPILRDVRHVELPGSSHVMFSAEGHENVVAAIDDFLSELPPVAS